MDLGEYAEPAPAPYPGVDDDGVGVEGGGDGRVPVRAADQHVEPAVGSQDLVDLPHPPAVALGDQYTHFRSPSLTPSGVLYRQGCCSEPALGRAEGPLVAWPFGPTAGSAAAGKLVGSKNH
jgi:hypothetical protein